MKRNDPKDERGYALAVVVVFTTVLLVSLSGAVINWQKAMQREREEELIFRGKQFVRAIELWQRKFPGTFPTSIDALLNTNNMRFLRKKWKDPITNSSEWRLIKLNPDGSLSGLTMIPTGGYFPATTRGISGQSRSGGFGSPPSGPVENPQANRAFRSQSNPQNLGTVPASQVRRSTLQPSAPILGGIVGVASTSEKESLKTYNGRSKYNEWEFFYVPRPQPQPRLAPGQQPPGQRPGVGPATGRGTQPPGSQFRQPMPRGPFPQNPTP